MKLFSRDSRKWIRVFFVIASIPSYCFAQQPQEDKLGESVVAALKQRATWKEPIQIVAALSKRKLKDGKIVSVRNEWFRLAMIPSQDEYRLDYLFDAPTGRGARAMWSCLHNSDRSVRVIRGVDESIIDKIKSLDFTSLKTGMACIGISLAPSIDYMIRPFGFKTEYHSSDLEAANWKPFMHHNGERFSVEHENYKFEYDLVKRLPIVTTLLSASKPGEILERITVDSTFQAGDLWLPSKFSGQYISKSTRYDELRLDYVVDTKLTKILTQEEWQNLRTTVILKGASVVDELQKIKYTAVEDGDGSKTQSMEDIHKILKDSLKQIAPSPAK